MASVWFWLLIAFLSLMAGFIIVAFFYMAYGFVRDWFRKRKFPRDKKKLSEFIEANKDLFKSTGKQKIDQKEVEEDERRRAERFREFEKLRRLAKSNPAERKSDIVLSERPGVQGRGIVPGKPDSVAGKDKRVVEFD